MKQTSASGDAACEALFECAPRPLPILETLMAGLPWPGWAPPDAEAWLENAFADPTRAARTLKAVGHEQNY
jgi:hypothetical protein